MTKNIKNVILDTDLIFKGVKMKWYYKLISVVVLVTSLFLGTKLIDFMLIKEETSALELTVKEEQNPNVITDTKSIVYDNMTLDELGEKLEKSLNSDLKGKGLLFAKLAIELEVDPYIALAISLHETGCTWNCSTLLKQCNNVGGQKGSPSCNNGSYRKFETLDSGIEQFMINLSVNYFKKGLTTPDAIGSKYAEDKTWSTKINNYIIKIKSA